MLVYDKTYNQVIALFLHTTNMKSQAVVLQLVAMVISLLRDKYIIKLPFLQTRISILTMQNRKWLKLSVKMLIGNST